jgi:hypothetical protein
MANIIFKDNTIEINKEDYKLSVLNKCGSGSRLNKFKKWLKTTTLTDSSIAALAYLDIIPPEEAISLSNKNKHELTYKELRQHITEKINLTQYGVYVDVNSLEKTRQFIHDLKKLLGENQCAVAKLLRQQDTNATKPFMCNGQSRNNGDTVVFTKINGELFTIYLLKGESINCNDAKHVFDNWQSECINIVGLIIYKSTEVASTLFSKQDSKSVNDTIPLANVSEMNISASPQTKKTIKTRKTATPGEIEYFKKKTATRKLRSFFKSKVPEFPRIMKKITSRFLNHICTDSGVCIAFGKELGIIKNHFDNFLNFTYVSQIRRIGEPSANGFVNEITYDREGYKSHAILKSSTTPLADNLLYETLVGLYVNKLNMIYPCFLETYGIYGYKTGTEWTRLKNGSRDKKILNDLILLNSIPEVDELVSISCKNSQYLCVLIQNIKDAKSLESMLNKREFSKNHLMYVLYQIYMTLSCVSNNFTHYDLHAGNVLLYEPVKGKYIEYHYHKDNQEIVFKSPYLSKIIDYGRCFFKDDNNRSKLGSSTKIHKAVCEHKSCKPDCGLSAGYSWLECSNSANNHYICSTERNISHDLRLLYILRSVYPQFPFFNKINYCNGFNYRNPCQGFGTIENTRRGLPDIINNVLDAHDELLRVITDPHTIDNNDAIFNDPNEKLGELHVYYDGRPMKFIENKRTNKKTVAELRSIREQEERLKREQEDLSRREEHERLKREQEDRLTREQQYLRRNKLYQKPNIFGINIPNTKKDTQIPFARPSKKLKFDKLKE